MSIEATKDQLKSQLHEQVGIINSLKMKYDELVTSKQHSDKYLSSVTVLKSEKDCHDQKLQKCNTESLKKVEEMLAIEGSLFSDLENLQNQVSLAREENQQKDAEIKELQTSITRLQNSDEEKCLEMTMLQ